MIYSFLQSFIVHAAASPSLVLIDGATGDLGGIAGDNVKFDTFLNAVVPVTVAVGITAAVVLVAMAGYKMSTSSGDSTKIKDAKEQIQNAIMGLLLILGAVSITAIIMSTLNITIN